jgi:dihydrofolate synthase / folylpolyglutamate synthase
MDHPDAILSRFLPLHPKKIDLSLSRIERLLAALNHPETRLPPVIHVAGTNGKGSTIAFLRAVLEAAGLRVHVYTSPHLVRFHERIRLGRRGAGALVDDERLFDAFDACERVNGGQPITVFEITTAAAFKLFSENAADYLLLEVGLGGRVDATNVIDRPVATVVTPVSIDHPEHLGSTVEQIAKEKAGIFKTAVPAILSAQSPAALAVLERAAAARRVPLLIGGQDYWAREEHGRLVYEDEYGLLDLPLPRLLGRHQHGNAGTAIATLRYLDPSLRADVFEQGMLQADWPARLQRLARGHLVDLAPDHAELWLDGGHNEEGGRALAQALADFEEKSSRPLVVICGMLTTKDPATFLGFFKGLAQEILAVPIAHQELSRPAANVAAAAHCVGLPAVACASVNQALSYLSARDWNIPPRLLITGSLYLAGDVLAFNGTPPN